MNNWPRLDKANVAVEVEEILRTPGQVNYDITGNSCPATKIRVLPELKRENNSDVSRGGALYSPAIAGTMYASRERYRVPNSTGTDFRIVAANSGSVCH